MFDVNLDVNGLTRSVSARCRGGDRFESRLNITKDGKKGVSCAAMLCARH